MKTDTYFVISRFKENIDWVDKHFAYYAIYNKSGEELEHDNVIDVPNAGNNQGDIFRYCYTNYERIPSLVGFVQANPFDACNQELFEKLINNKWFTCLEGFEDNIEGGAYKKSPVDRLYMEVNIPWYIASHNATYGLKCKYSSFDEFMNKYFVDYKSLEWIRFSPGSQYIVEKERITGYSREFWKSLMEELPMNNMTEGHIIERALWHILNHTYTARF